MRTLSLNLDLCDAEILRDAVANHLQRQSGNGEPTLVDPNTQSLRATLIELNQMIERPVARQRVSIRAGQREPAPVLRRVH